MDKLTPEARSRNMAAIRSANTSPEVLLRKWLFSQGYRYRICAKYIPGKPDIFLRRYNTAVFVNGCFWHRHSGCRYATTPKSNSEYWTGKFERNLARDAEVRRQLSEKGIRVLTVWECTISKMKKDSLYRDSMLTEISSFLNGSADSAEM